MIEGNGGIEETLHIGNLSRLPPAAAQFRVVSFASQKHGFHVHRVGEIPRRQILIEGLGALEHESKVFPVRDIPVRNVFVERGLIEKDFGKVGHAVDAPTSNGKAILFRNRRVGSGTGNVLVGRGAELHDRTKTCY